MIYQAYHSDRPNLVITYDGGGSLGNCYRYMSYKITSLRRLSQQQINLLHDANLLGYGQEFYIHSQCDGKEEPAGKDTLTYKTIDNGVVISEDVNHTMEQPYYIYNCESRVDSSD